MSICQMIADSIAPLPRPLVVGISGAYTSGKTTFATALAGELQSRGIKVQIVHYDDFHHPFQTIHYAPEDEIEAYYNRAFDPEKLVREVLNPLKRDGQLHAQLDCVNLGKGDFSNRVSLNIDSDTIVLLEGVMLLRPPILPHLDHKIHLHITADEILRRGELRDVPLYGAQILPLFTSRYIPANRRYEREHDPQSKADIVIDNGDCAHPAILRS